MQRSYTEIFFKLLETITCDLLYPKFKDYKILPLKNFVNFKDFDNEIVNVQE